MPKLSRIGIAAAALAISSCSTTEVGQSAVSDRFDVAEHVIRDLYTVVGPERIAAVCFPKLTDPSPRFLNRLGNLSLAPCSALKESRPGTVSVIESTGQLAVTIYIERIDMSTPDAITVTAAHWREALDGGGYTFLFHRTDGRWTLVEKKSIWIG